MLAPLERVLVFPNGDAPSLKHSQEEASHRLHRYREHFGKEPATFMQFIFFRELELATGQKLADTLKTLAHGNVDDTDKVWGAYVKPIPLSFCLKEESSRRVGDTEAKIRPFVLEGIGFGSAFPELTGKMIRTYYESIDLESDEWVKEKAAGYRIPERILSLEQQEEGLLCSVALYTHGCYPELLDPLDLRRYLEIKGERAFWWDWWWNDWKLIYPSDLK
ncbi:MAG: hypothetical protein V1849_00335 [Chloroflexota bacterium]